MRNDVITPLPCPFCGKPPRVFPEDSTVDGNAWGSVECKNPECHVRPMCLDGCDIADDRGREAYQELAILRWNKRGHAT